MSGPIRSTSAPAFPLAQLPDVEVEPAVRAILDALPAEEDVACRLDQPLPDHHPLRMVLELARLEERLQHRLSRLPDLQEEQVVLVAAEEQRDPGPRAGAADLAPELDEAVLVEQPALFR